MTSRTRRTTLYVFDGQSLAINPTASQSICYPAKVMADFTHAYYPAPLTTCRAGTGWGGVTQRAGDATRRIDSHLTNVPAGARTVLIDCGGTNEVALSVDPATAIAAAEAYWGARFSAGWDEVYAITVPDAGDFDAAKDIIRADLNTLIRTSSVPTAVIDTDTVPEFTDHTSSAYNPDLVHLDPSGHTQMADLILGVLP